MTTTEFQQIVYDYYSRHGRAHLPWRVQPTPYYVLVSELMLQQTQVERVIPKFNMFVQLFTNEQELAAAPLADVLRTWQGLGYNRRARYLHEAAKSICQSGSFPETKQALMQLPGVGPNTAAAIRVYAFDQVDIYVETNIRTVFFHHFFHDQTDVPDSRLLPLAERMLDRSQPRVWYSALMDYGTFLKQQGAGRISRSAHYKKQSKFEGSLRQMRGAIVRALTNGESSETALRKQLPADERFEPALSGLVTEGLVVRESGYVRLRR